MSEHEAIRRADDTNMWVGVKELQERIALLEQHIRVVEAENKALRESAADVCWHCKVCLEPAPVHCESCPPPGDCDVEGCEAEGCRP